MQINGESSKAIVIDETDLRDHFRRSLVGAIANQRVAAEDTTVCY